MTNTVTLHPFPVELVTVGKNLDLNIVDAKAVGTIFCRNYYVSRSKSVECHLFYSVAMSKNLRKYSKM